MDKKYSYIVTARTPRPRSERLRKLGSGSGGGSVLSGACMDPLLAMKVEESYQKLANYDLLVTKMEALHLKLANYAPTSIVVMTEAELEKAAEDGTLIEGVLYLGTEEEEL